MLSNSHTTRNSIVLSNSSNYQNQNIVPDHPIADGIKNPQTKKLPNPDLTGKDIDDEIIGCSITSSKLNRLELVNSSNDIYND